MSLTMWQELSCKCGSEQFTRIYSLQWHKTQGTNEKPTGWECAGCRKKVDLPGLIRDQVLKEKHRELTELTQELSGAAGVPIQQESQTKSDT